MIDTKTKDANTEKERVVREAQEKTAKEHGAKAEKHEGKNVK